MVCEAGGVGVGSISEESVRWDVVGHVHTRQDERRAHIGVVGMTRHHLESIIKRRVVLWDKWYV